MPPRHVAIGAPPFAVANWARVAASRFSRPYRCAWLKAPPGIDLGTRIRRAAARSRLLSQPAASGNAGLTGRWVLLSCLTQMAPATVCDRFPGFGASGSTVMSSPHVLHPQALIGRLGVVLLVPGVSCQELSH